ncbi:MAG: winged helix-turn-helix transcriptional regulator [Muribaculaceae bacterium]|nr:winged helix-turn-helix transcriptional regulator [Muribaculaceae bacterium]
MDIIKDNPTITRRELTQKTGLSDSTLKRERADLKAKGYIRRQESTAHGVWIVNDNE